MNILILHRIPYHKINYHLGIDHNKHHVTYIGLEDSLLNIPEDLICSKIARSGKEKIIIEVSEWIENTGLKFDRVISLSEYELLDAAEIREQFSISGALPHEVEKVRNKLLMKQAVLAANLVAPRYLKLDENLKLTDFTWSGKTVLKPIDGASSQDVLIFDSPELVVDALFSKNTGIASLDEDVSNIRNFECEEFVEGDILHFDGLLNNGELIAVLPSKYIGNCLAYALGQPLGSIQFQLNDAAKEWVIKNLQAVGIQDGSFHLEAIQRGNELVFLEVANRVGGAEVVSTFELATGLHLPSLELKILTGEPFELNSKKQVQQYFGWFVFPGHHLSYNYAEIRNHESYSQHPSVVRWNQLSKEQKLTKHITYQATEVPVAGIIQADDPMQLENFLSDMFSTVYVKEISKSVPAVA